MDNKQEKHKKELTDKVKESRKRYYMKLYDRIMEEQGEKRNE